MRNLIEYRYHIEELFFKFVTNKISLAEMISALKHLEISVQIKNENTEQGLWFKFGSKDTLCTTIDDLERDLNPSNKNYGFTFDRVVEAYTLRGVNTDSELLIYFS